MSETLMLERSERVVRLILNRPPLNILDLPTIARLREQLQALAGEPELQLVVIAGAGERAFSAGVAVEDHTGDRVAALLAEFHGAIRQLRQLPAATLAVVQGHCLGGGMELAAACDMILATEDSQFGQPEIKLGCYPPLAAALYPSLLGSARAFDLLLTGRTVGCEEADRMGLVTRRVPRSELESMLEGLIEEITRHSLVVTRLATRALRAGRDRAFDEALAEAESLYLEELVATEDMREGLAAFMEKRQPRWTHR